MKRLWIIVLVLLVAAAAVAGVLAWKWKSSGTKVVRGSSTQEFVTTQSPEPPKEPPRFLRTVAWPMYGYGPSRTHLAPSSFRERPPYHVLWTKRAHFYIEFPPAVAYGRVFLAQLKGRFYAINARTGKVVWRRRWKHACSPSSPAVGGGRVYEVYLPPPCNYGNRSAYGSVVAWNAHTGERLWRLPILGGSESSPLLVGHTLYFGSWNHHLYALDVRGRKPHIRWRFLADSELNGAPAYAGGTIFIGSHGGYVYAVNARTGRLRWRASAYSSFIGGRQEFYSTPAVAYGRVFIGNADGTTYAFGAGSGHLLWAQHTGSYVYSSPAVWNRTVYIGSYDGNMYALNAATGDVRWRYAAPSAIHGGPTLLAGLLYFSACGTCGHRGSRPAKQGRHATIAIDARTGRRVWEFPDGKYSPLVADGTRVYLAGRTRLYALVPCSRWIARAPKGEKRRKHGPPHARRC